MIHAESELSPIDYRIAEDLMKRFALEKLIEWKDKQNRKPLIIRGARQVGKTWLMKEFAYV